MDGVATPGASSEYLEVSPPRSSASSGQQRRSARSAWSEVRPRASLCCSRRRRLAKSIVPRAAKQVLRTAFCRVGREIPRLPAGRYKSTSADAAASIKFVAARVSSSPSVQHIMSAAAVPAGWSKQQLFKPKVPRSQLEASAPRDTNHRAGGALRSTAHRGIRRGQGQALRAKVQPSRAQWRRFAHRCARARQAHAAVGGGRKGGGGG